MKKNKLMKNEDCQCRQNAINIDECIWMTNIQVLHNKWDLTKFVR